MLLKYLNTFYGYGIGFDMYKMVKQRPCWATLFDDWRLNSLEFLSDYAYTKDTLIQMVMEGEVTRLTPLLTY